MACDLRRLADSIRLHAGCDPPEPLAVVRDTTDFMAIDRGHVVEVGDRVFFVTGTIREKRFTLEDEPKFWVKRAVDLVSGQRHILKMYFLERFRVQVGERSFLCRRSPEKEASVLEYVWGDDRFMQGVSLADDRGNLVRVLDYLPGTDLISHLRAMELPHEAYFHMAFPSVLAGITSSFQAVQTLHDGGLCHGDIRNDHVWVTGGAKGFRWIDFDLLQDDLLFDVLSAGNVLHFAVGKEFVTFGETLAGRPGLSGRFTDGDASIFFPHRIMNLRTVYPYIPKRLNDVLLRFSRGAAVRYDSMRQVVEDLFDCAAAMGWRTATNKL